MSLPKGHATLDEAVRRAVISLKPNNHLANALRNSPFLNFTDGNHPEGVLPHEDDLLAFRPFSGGEHIFTVLPLEKPHELPNRGNGNGDIDTHHYYIDPSGTKMRYFDDTLGSELEGRFVYIVATPSRHWMPDQVAFRMQQVTRTVKEMGGKPYVVFSEFPFARQDRGVRRFSRADTAGSLVQDQTKHFGQTDTISVLLRGLIANSCDGIVTLHHHSGHIQEATRDCLLELGRDPQKLYLFDLSPAPLLAHYLLQTDIFSDEEKANNGEGLFFAAPDEGALPFVREVWKMSGYTRAEIALIRKWRERPNDPHSLRGELVPVDNFPGDYNGKTGIVLDDMVDTFGTMSQALDFLQKGVRRFVVYGTHGIFSERAEDLMKRHRRISDVILMKTRPSRIYDFGPEARRKLTILAGGEYFAHALAYCVEKQVDPRAYYQELFFSVPSFFDRLVTEERDVQHYLRRGGMRRG